MKRYLMVIHSTYLNFRVDQSQAYILTKGDDNQVDDRALYPDQKEWLSRHDLLGCVTG